MIKKLANVMTLAITLLALAGCGSGGGEDSGYTGKTAPTALTASNATEMSIDVVDGVNSVSGLGAIAKGVAGTSTPDNAIQVRSLSDTLERSVARMVEKPALAKTVAEAVSATVYGYSGSYSYSGTADSSTGKFAATFTFSAYQEAAGAEVMSGSISVSGTVFAQQGGGVDNLTITVPSLQISESPGGGVLMTVKGKMTIVNGADKTLTLSLVFIDGATGATYWYKDFTIVDSGYDTTISGTFFHPLHGYVVVTTLQPLSDTTNSYGDPISGQILFTGSNGSKVRLTYTGTGYLLDLDANGTGVYVAL